MNFRYERKFKIDSLSLPQIESIVRSHPAKFEEAYEPRKVNSLYLDDINMQNVEDNLAGLANREKERVRWYGETFSETKSPILEIKIKRGLLGTKEHHPLKPFILDDSFCKDSIQKLFEDSNLPEYNMHILNFRNPTILDVYTRKYFVSSDKKFRLTLDFDIKYFKVNQLFNTFLESVSSTDVVLELKYEAIFDNEVESITNYFPFRVTKSSKYVSGADYFYFVS
jgi:SPX domain protein involved in polyphosphate accumulation